MSNFPQDIIINILSRLPAKSLGRFKCVCKPWLHLISDPNFVKMHFLREAQTNNFNLILCTLNEDNLYSVHNQTAFSKAVEIKHPGKTQYNSIQVLGSCNGLLYIETVHYEAIWNPCTKEFKKIPESPETHYYSEQTFHGFSYDPTIDDYKAVKVVQPSKKSKGYTGSEVMVFTMGTNSWRKVENINYHLHCDPALCVSEYIVWLAKAGGKYGGPDSFVFFHLVDEKFRKVSLPSECVNHMVCATVLDGHLCILNDGEKVQGDVWVMKEDGGKESWSKLFTVAAEERHEPEPVRFKVISSFSWLKVLCLTKTGDVLLAYDDGDLLLYVPKLDTIKILPMLITPRQFTATPYVESLVSLKSGTYVGRKQTKRKRGPSTISRW